MQPDFWLRRWERGETGWHKSEINAHLRELWPGLGLPGGSEVLVPLCGKTLDLLWLAAQGHRVLGVELSERAVEAFFAENGLAPRTTETSSLRSYRVDEIEILCGDLFDLGPERLAATGAVYDRASLIALPPELRERYVAHLEAVLPARVPWLLIAMEYDQALMPGPPFSVPRDEVESLFAGHHRVVPAAELDVLDDWPHVRARGLERMVERVYRLEPV